MLPLGERLRAGLVSVALVVAVAEPAFRSPQDDGFPLSTYPMFSRGRKSPEAKISHVVAVYDGGERVAIPPGLVANDEVMQAHATVRNAVRRGRSSAKRLCRRVAASVAASGETGLLTAERLEVRTDRYDAVTYFAGNREPLSSKLHARCAVAP